MSEASDDDHVDPAIGVGMGGSCPSCRAPVDLGQEFCLECGAAIRFTARQRRQQQRAEGGAPATTSSAPAAMRNRFPWVPFAIVLVLVLAGVAFALTDGSGSSGSNDKGSGTTEPALPTITNSSPPETSATETTTLEDCDPARPLDGTQEAVPSASDTGGADPGAFDQTDIGSAGDRIPSVDADGGTSATNDPVADSAFDEAPPASGESAGTAGTVTVDAAGDICTPEDIAANDSSADPVTPTPSPSPSPTPTPTPSASGSDDWPADKDGWTVIVAGYKDDESKARKLAADLKTNGFESGVLFSTNFRSLCPGIWVAYSGSFDTREKAEAHQAALSAKSYQSTYAREVRRTGAAPTGCPS